ncbi:replication initiation protein, partial [Arsenicibacter rosenii]|uniref:replication initiation protein n=1 Tax=Arsenicibacter rosenii TaxID=1750698 RepID=UPI001160CBDA
MKKKGNPHLVVQSNNFLNLRHTLNIHEARVFLTMVAQIEPDDVDFNTYRIEVTSFMKSLGLKGKGGYTILKEVAESLIQKTFKRLDPKGSFELIGYISYAKYVVGQSYMELSFDPRLKPYLLNLKEAFTQYDIRYILTLRSINTVRLYELLKSNEFQKKVEYSFDELKEKLNLADKYARFADFKLYVLDPARKELKKLTDISFDYAPVKSGKSVIGVSFIIYSQKNTGEEAIDLIPATPLDIPTLIIVPTVTPEMVRLFQQIEPNLTPDDIGDFVNELNTSQNRILDTLLYAINERRKGVLIKSIFAYVKAGLKSNLGKGLHAEMLRKEQQKAALKRKQADNREISKWRAEEFADYLEYYYTQIGQQADSVVKHQYFAYVNQQIQANPQLKSLYYQADGSVIKEMFQVTLGKALSKEQGEDEDQIFISFCQEKKGANIKREGDLWIRAD